MTSQTCKPLAEKEILMFRAVNDLVREGRDIKELTVQEITKKAGIGKGTAYEYFKTKEELVGKAVMFGVMEEMTYLSQLAEKCANFEEMIYKVFEWIDYNVKNRQTVEHLINYLPRDCKEEADCNQKKMGECAGNHFISKLAEVGIRESAFENKNAFYVESAIISQLISYAVSVISERVHTQEEIAAFKKFSYEAIIKMLN